MGSFIKNIPERTENYLSLTHPVFLTDTASILQVSSPGEAEGSSLEVSVGEHVGETEVVVIFLCKGLISSYLFTIFTAKLFT